MKKIVIILTVCIIASMTGCGQGGNNFDLEKLTFYNDCIVTVSYSGNGKECKAFAENMLFSFFK